MHQGVQRCAKRHDQQQSFGLNCCWLGLAAGNGRKPLACCSPALYSQPARPLCTQAGSPEEHSTPRPELHLGQQLLAGHQHRAVDLDALGRVAR